MCSNTDDEKHINRHQKKTRFAHYEHVQNEHLNRKKNMEQHHHKKSPTAESRFAHLFLVCKMNAKVNRGENNPRARSNWMSPTWLGSPCNSGTWSMYLKSTPTARGLTLPLGPHAIREVDVVRLPLDRTGRRSGEGRIQQQGPDRHHGGCSHLSWTP